MDGTSNKPYVSGVEKISKNWKKKRKVVRIITHIKRVTISTDKSEKQKSFGS